MLRQFFRVQCSAQNRGSGLLGLTIIGVLALSIFLTADIANAATLSGFGTQGNLPNVWVKVVARDLDYINPIGSWVSVSCHEYEIVNYQTFEVRYDYEFRHWVVELTDTGEDGNTVIDVPPKARSNIKLPSFASDFNGGVLTANCDHLEVGRRYGVRAYTRIAAWKTRQPWKSDNWQVNEEHNFTAQE